MVGRKKRDTRTLSLFAAGAPRRAAPEPFVPGPNSRLAEFVRQHSTPYEPKKDKYNASAFDRDLYVHKHNKLYTMHLYWSKKDPLAIREYIEHYTDEGALVLDPFAGAGTTGCAAMVSGRHAVLLEVSCSAGFIAHHYCLMVPPEDAERSLNHLLSDTKKDLIDKELFGTKCDRCGEEAITEFVIWSDLYQCGNCGKLVPLFDCTEAKVVCADGEEKSKVVCPHCLARSHGKASQSMVISTRSPKHGSMPVACKYLCTSGCKPKGAIRLHNDKNKKARTHFEQYDLAAIKAVTLRSVKKWYPTRRMMDAPADRKVWGAKWRSGSACFELPSELFTTRNLRALSELRDASKSDTAVSPLLFLTWVLHKCSNLMGYNRDGVGRVDKGNYYTPPIRLEARPTKYLDQASKAIYAHYKEKMQYPQNVDFCLSVERNLSAFERIPNNSVDYIFTDPPYLNPEVQYGEMNFLWDAWLDFPSSLKDEITLNLFQDHTWEEAESLLRLSLAGMYDILKPGRWASICYHDTSEANWTMLQNALLDAGFEIHTVTCLDPRSKSRKAITAEKIVKSDLVLNCRKPLADEDGSTEAERTRISQRVREIVVENLAAHGGQTRDKLWNFVLKRLLARGQMAAHRFDDLLSEVAVKAEGGRWYLKDEFQQLSEDDLKNEEHAGESLVRFARLRCTGVPVKYAATIANEHPKLCGVDNRGRLDEKEIERWVNDHLLPEDKMLLVKGKAKRLELGGRLAGIEFYDALFFYLTKYMKNRRADQLPKRNVADFLEEYVVRFADGDRWLYRPPAGSEESEMRKARQSGLGRRIRAFANALRDGERDYTDEHRPDVKTFVEWLRYCAAYGHYEDGATLYDQGGFTVDQLQRVVVDEEEEETAYEAARGFADICKRRLRKTEPGEDSEEGEDDGEE